MSREIKFRVWDGKEMREPPPLNEWDMEDGEFWVEYCDNPIMQYTGRKEDEGGQEREIYEGDIILHGGGELRGPGVVKWCQYSLGFKVFRGTNRYDIYRPEIIGNIHEHPSLIPAT